MSANQEHGPEGFGPWPPDCADLVRQIQESFAAEGPHVPAGESNVKYCGVQVRGDGSSIRSYRVKVLSHGKIDTNPFNRWPPQCPAFVHDIEQTWERAGKPQGVCCIVQLEVTNPLSGYLVIHSPHNS
jgi:hypothetical protein